MRLLPFWLACVTGLVYQPTELQAELLASNEVTVGSNCPSRLQQVVLTGQQLPALTGLPVSRLMLSRWSGTAMQPVVFQIDRRDEDDRYLFSADTAAGTHSQHPEFDANDELVFIFSDAGQRLPSQSKEYRSGRFIELGIQDSGLQEQRWIYLSLSDSVVKPSGKKYIKYYPDADSIATDLYRLGFSRQSPFLMDSFNWWDAPAKQWSLDLLDTMKIRHNGKLLGLIDFKRTQDDYSSRLTAIKRGPVRVIRRTENRVRVFLGLKTPALTIDYVLAADGFVMDTTVDIPFSMGMLFSRIETLTTVDWKKQPDLASMLVSNTQLSGDLQIDGVMTEQKQAFNKISDTRFKITSPSGVMQVSLDIPENFPIKAFLYLRDALNEADPPETVEGQFGNVGFRTTGWENIDSSVHHLRFTVCLYPENRS